MSECPTTPLGVSVCAELMKRIMTQVAAQLGGACEITVSTTPPIVAGTWTVDPFTCPHGVTYWIEPTGEQVADWAARGVR